MFKISLQHWVIGVLTLGVTCMPLSMHAAELKFNVVPVSGVADSVTRVDVRIDPQSKRLNVVEGVIQFGGPASDNLTVQVENGQSMLPMWPTPPQYDPRTKSIRFTGGVPNGFESEGLLFRLLISSTVTGDFTMSYTEGSAYINDGKGTKEPMKATPLTIQAGVSGSTDNSSRSSTYTYGIIIVLIIVVCAGIFIYGLRHKEKQL